MQSTVADKIFMDSRARGVEAYLRERGFEHVRTRHRGKVITVESGPQEDPVRHARFRKDTVHLWLLEIADHRGRFERTGLRDTLDNLKEALAITFPWVLEKIV